MRESLHGGISLFAETALRREGKSLAMVRPGLPLSPSLILDVLGDTRQALPFHTLYKRNLENAGMLICLLHLEEGRPVESVRVKSAYVAKSRDEHFRRSIW